ncbi:MAG: hypothetical protein PHN88_15525 [Ignavibacteria bacterium]|nr:hypothetical protein [Ignavibacteria bacterium]
MSDDIKKNRFFELRFNGNNISSAAGTLGVSYATAKRWNKDLVSVVKSVNIKKAIESSILSALSRFENYSNLLSAEFAKLQADAQKYDSVNLYYEDRMNFLLKIIHMDRRLNNSMLNLLKMNKDLASTPPDVQSSIDNLKCSIDDDKLEAFIFSENEKMKTDILDKQINSDSITEENNDDTPDEDNIDDTPDEDDTDEDNEYATEDDTAEKNNDDTSNEDNGEDYSDDDSADNTDEDIENSYDEKNNDEDNIHEDNIHEDNVDTSNKDNTGNNNENTLDGDSIDEIIKKEYSNGISIAEYEELLKRLTPLKEAELIMKKPPKPANKYGGSMYKPKPVDT